MTEWPIPPARNRWLGEAEAEETGDGITDEHLPAAAADSEVHLLEWVRGEE